MTRGLPGRKRGLGGRSADALPRRGTGEALPDEVVYRREDGVWKMVHFHSSIGVPNEDAIGVELPT